MIFRMSDSLNPFSSAVNDTGDARPSPCGQSEPNRILSTPMTRASSGKSTFEGFGAKDPLDQVLLDDRAIHDTMASMIVHGVFTRHPKLKAVSIENGSYFVHRLIKRLKKAANTQPQYFPEDPVEQLRNNVWIAPYYEDDLPELARVIGVDKILFGSDWPHGEGLASPVSFTAELKGFSESDIRKIMRDNALDLLGVQVGSAA